LVYRFTFNVDRSRQNLMTSYLSNTDKMNGELKTKLEEMFPTEKLITKIKIYNKIENNYEEY
jgi:hypothetical protein